MLNTSSGSLERKIVFIGDSTPLRTLRTWVRGSGLTVADQPEIGVLCVVADEIVLDGQCTPDQGQRLAKSRSLGLECLPPTLARDWLVDTVGLMSDRAERETGSGSLPY